MKNPVNLLVILLIMVLGYADIPDDLREEAKGGSSACVNPSSYGSFNPVTIGGQTWMKENLNYAACGSVCYNNDPANCDKYGRLYNWATAMALPSSCNSSTCSGQIQSKHRGVCPAGWHIPSKDEWDALASFIESDKGCSYCDAKHLKATSGWNEGGNGLNSYGFAALPGGFGNSGGYFDFAGYHGLWWSSSEGVSGYAYLRTMFYNYEDASWYYGGKYRLFSVRCLQD